MKCIINGKLVLRDKVADGLAIVFDRKIEKIANVQDLDISDYDVIDACGNFGTYDGKL